MPIVRMPDGAQVRFPDEMPAEEIRGIIATRFPEAAAPAELPEDTTLIEPVNELTAVEPIQEARGAIPEEDLLPTQRGEAYPKFQPSKADEAELALGIMETDPLNPQAAQRLEAERIAREKADYDKKFINWQFGEGVFKPESAGPLDFSIRRDLAASDTIENKMDKAATLYSDLYEFFPAYTADGQFLAYRVKGDKENVYPVDPEGFDVGDFADYLGNPLLAALDLGTVATAAFTKNPQITSALRTAGLYGLASGIESGIEQYRGFTEEARDPEATGTDIGMAIATDAIKQGAVEGLVQKGTNVLTTFMPGVARRPEAVNEQTREAIQAAEELGLAKLTVGQKAGGLIEAREQQLAAQNNVLVDFYQQQEDRLVDWMKQNKRYDANVDTLSSDALDYSAARLAEIKSALKTPEGSQFEVGQQIQQGIQDVVTGYKNAARSKYKEMEELGDIGIDMTDVFQEIGQIQNGVPMRGAGTEADVVYNSLDPKVRNLVKRIGSTEGLVTHYNGSNSMEQLQAMLKDSFELAQPTPGATQRTNSQRIALDIHNKLRKEIFDNPDRVTYGATGDAAKQALIDANAYWKKALDFQEMDKIRELAQNPEPGAVAAYVAQTPHLERTLQTLAEEAPEGVDLIKAAMTNDLARDPLNITAKLDNLPPEVRNIIFDKADMESLRQVQRNTRGLMGERAVALANDASMSATAFREAVLKDAVNDIQPLYNLIENSPPRVKEVLAKGFYADMFNDTMDAVATGQYKPNLKKVSAYVSKWDQPFTLVNGNEINALEYIVGRDAAKELRQVRAYAGAIGRTGQDAGTSLQKASLAEKLLNLATYLTPRKNQAMIIDSLLTVGTAGRQAAYFMGDKKYGLNPVGVYVAMRGADAERAAFGTGEAKQKLKGVVNSLASATGRITLRMDEEMEKDEEAIRTLGLLMRTGARSPQDLTGELNVEEIENNLN